MSNQGRYIYHYCVKYSLNNEKKLIETWNRHHINTQYPVNPELHKRGYHFKRTVEEIAALGASMNQEERRILERILMFMVYPLEALMELMEDKEKPLIFKNSDTLPAIISRWMEDEEEVNYYQALITSALNAENSNQQQEVQRPSKT